MIIEFIKRLFKKPTIKQASEIMAERDPYAPKGKNRPYPNDKYAEEYIRGWLNDVFDKHYG